MGCELLSTVKQCVNEIIVTTFETTFAGLPLEKLNTLYEFYALFQRQDISFSPFARNIHEYTYSSVQYRNRQIIFQIKPAKRMFWLRLTIPCISWYLMVGMVHNNMLNFNLDFIFRPEVLIHILSHRLKIALKDGMSSPHKHLKNALGMNRETSRC